MDLAGLLRAASVSPSDDLWRELWDHLCHQGTVSRTSYDALTPLTHLAQEQPPSGYNAALGLAAAILSSSDRPMDVDIAAVRTAHADDVRRLRVLAEEVLPRAVGPIEFAHGLRILAEIDGVAWCAALHRLTDEEVAVQCPACGEWLEVPLQLGGVVPTWSLPVEASSLLGHRALLVALASQHHHHDVAQSLLSLFGQASCPECDSRFDVARACV